MSLRLQQSEHFLADAEVQFRWYVEQAGPDVARRYRQSLQATIMMLLETPELGRPRFRDDPQLTGLRSLVLLRPFQKQLLFYRVAGRDLILERTVHGSRDLPRRLVEPPR
jgi:plasmid stabilization system protein ParE